MTTFGLAKEQPNDENAIMATRTPTAPRPAVIGQFEAGSEEGTIGDVSYVTLIPATPEDRGSAGFASASGTGKIGPT